MNTVGIEFSKSPMYNFHFCDSQTIHPPILRCKICREIFEWRNPSSPITEKTKIITAKISLLDFASLTNDQKIFHILWNNVKIYQPLSAPFPFRKTPSDFAVDIKT